MCVKRIWLLGVALIALAARREAWLRFFDRAVIDDQTAGPGSILSRHDKGGSRHTRR
jgi:hypothetical protein